jgi:integrase
MLLRILARVVCSRWRDQWASKPRTADYAWSVLARLTSWAKDRGRIQVNPCERGGRLYRSDRSEIIWTEADIERLLIVAPAHLKVALLMGLWTGQRIGDLRTVTWTAYDGAFLRLTQSKTGRRVAIRVGAPLKVVLDGLPRTATTILATKRGTPWTHFGFQSSWRKAVAKAGLSGLHFHDLRGSAVSRLAEAGCTEAEIASITGHSLKDVGRMLDHYLKRSEKLAEAAILKLEMRTGGDQKL